ncbi:hypothetical protein BCN_P111 (plasmid) [Bacillus cereus NC7401]|nr:hypothetical protein BCN_P111 [Bacillus cereus NC7401]
MTIMNSQRSLRRIIAIEMYLTRLRPGIVGQGNTFRLCYRGSACRSREISCLHYRR